MQNWANCYKNTHYIDTLPIFITDNNTPEHTLLTKNFYKYNAIFDGAAIGQYLGGIDPRNTSSKNTVGFINETCIIDYSKYKFEWCKNKPYIIIKDIKYEIINLHIHSKNLKLFI